MGPMMTKRQFQRLFLVAVIPLVVAGIALFSTVIPAPTFVTIRCDQWFTGADNCRTTDGLGEPFDRMVESEAPAWFDVQGDGLNDAGWPSSIVTASTREIVSARILSVEPYLGTASGTGSPVHNLQGLVGQNISIVFGVEQGRDRTAYLDVIGCNAIEYSDSPEVYTAALCGVPEGVVRLGIALDAADAGALNRLRGAVREELEEARAELIWHYAIGALSLVAVFLLISAAVWLCRKAWAFIASA